jgi:hypothetical protein
MQGSKAAVAGAARTIVLPRFKLLPFNTPAVGAQLKRGDLVELAVTFVIVQNNGRGGKGSRGKGTTVMNAVKLSKLQTAAVPALRGIVTEVSYTVIQYTALYSRRRLNCCSSTCRVRLTLIKLG